MLNSTRAQKHQIPQFAGRRLRIHREYLRPKDTLPGSKKSDARVYNYGGQDSDVLTLVRGAERPTRSSERGLTKAKEEYTHA